MSAQQFSNTSGAAKRRARKRKCEAVAKIAGWMHKFIAVNKPENPNSTTTSGEAELLHTNNVRELSDEAEANMLKQICKIVTRIHQCVVKEFDLAAG